MDSGFHSTHNQTGELNRKAGLHASVLGQASSFPSSWIFLSARRTLLPAFSGSQGLRKVQGRARLTETTAERCARSQHVRNLLRFMHKSVREITACQGLQWLRSMHGPLMLLGFWRTWEMGREEKREKEHRLGSQHNRLNCKKSPVNVVRACLESRCWYFSCWWSASIPRHQTCSS